MTVLKYERNASGNSDEPAIASLQNSVLISARQNWHAAQKEQAAETSTLPEFSDCEFLTRESVWKCAQIISHDETGTLICERPAPMLTRSGVVRHKGMALNDIDPHERMIDLAEFERALKTHNPINGQYVAKNAVQVRVWEYLMLPFMREGKPLLAVIWKPDTLVNTVLVDALNTSAEGIVSALTQLDDQGNITGLTILHANSRFADIVGVDQTEVSGLGLRSVLPEVGKKSAWDGVREAMKSGKTRDTMLSLDRGENSLYLRVSIRPIPDGVTLTFTDITAIHRTGEVLKKKADELESEIARRKALEQKLRHLADTDGLSGLQNRRSFMEKAAGEFNRARRYETPLSLLLIDIDHFKRINDDFGHAAGDTAILALGEVFQSVARLGVDLLGRIGGEEFAVLLPSTEVSGAERFGERLRMIIERTDILADIHQFAVTASIGVSTLEPTDGSIADLFKRADEALYAAKGSGRNQINVV